MPAKRKISPGIPKNEDRKWEIFGIWKFYCLKNSLQINLTNVKPISIIYRNFSIRKMFKSFWWSLKRKQIKFPQLHLEDKSVLIKELRGRKSVGIPWKTKRKNQESRGDDISCVWCEMKVFPKKQPVVTSPEKRKCW